MSNLVEIETTCPASRHPSSLLLTSLQDDSAGLDMESIDADSCVQLSHNKDCLNEIRLTSASHLICGLNILSENKHFELFANSEFISTAQGSLFDSFDGSKIYMFDIDVDPALASLQLRIPGSSWVSVWMFKIQVRCTARGKEEKGSAGGTFDMSKVNKLLPSEKPLSKNAENFKTLFENFQSNRLEGASQGPPKMSDLMANPMLMAGFMKMKAEFNPPTASTLSPHPPASPPSSSLRPSPPSPSQTINKSDGAIDLESKLKLEMQTYLDFKFAQLESRILRRVEESEAKIFQRLDLILDKLDPR